MNKHNERAELPPLPQLPEPATRQIIDSFKPLEDFYTAEQMRDYARAAMQEAQPAEQANGREAVPFGTFVERNDGTTEFRRTGEAHSPTAQGYKFWNLYTTPSAQPARKWVGLDEEKAESLIEDLAEWSRYVDEDHAHQTLEKHVRDVLETHGIKDKQ